MSGDTSMHAASTPVRVLLVDDDPEAVARVCGFLEEDTPYDTATSATAAGAVVLARGRSFDVILLGVSDRLKLERLRQLQREIAGLPIVVLSSDEALGLEAARWGAQDCLVQGELSRAAIVRVIAYVIARHRSSESLRASERLLRESEDRLRLAMESTGLGAFDFSPQTGRLIWSDLAKRHIGLGPDATVTYPLFLSSLHPDERASIDTIARAVMRGENGGRYATEHRTLGIEDKKERWLASWGQVFFDASGKAERIIGITLDITERKRAEQALLDADRRRMEFLATLAHELRNPLAPVRFAVKILQAQAPPGANSHRALAVIDRQIAQLARLIDDLLDVSRITRDKVQLRTSHVALADVMRAAVETIEPLIAASGHTFTLAAPDSIVIDADASRLVQVFSNLLNNACKFTPPGGRIAFQAEAGTSFVVVRVVDSGIGLAPQSLSRVFDLFRQEDVSLERSAGGLGIGLTLAKTLVERHGGTIDVKSAGIGLGAEFIVSLPLVAGMASVEPSGRDAASGAASRALQVLIVDDHADAAEMLQVFALAQGHKTAMAYEAGTALTMAESMRPDVILLDIGLPGLNGYDLARLLRERSDLEHAYIIAITGWGQEEDRRRAREAGFDFHLTKPVDPPALQRLLNGIAHTIGCEGCERCLQRARTRARDAGV